MDITIPQWIVDIVLWFVHLFSITEWKAIAQIVLFTLALTHTFKLAWRLSRIRGGGNPLALNLFAAVASFICAFLMWPREQSQWWLAGVICGPLAIASFKLGFALLKWKFPELAKIINVDRRKERMPLPPVGVSDRRQ